MSDRSTIRSYSRMSPVVVERADPATIEAGKLVFYLGKFECLQTATVAFERAYLHICLASMPTAANPYKIKLLTTCFRSCFQSFLLRSGQTSGYWHV